MIAMKYGAGEESGALNAEGYPVYLGYATSNGDVDLKCPVNRFRFLMFVGYASSTIYATEIVSAEDDSMFVSGWPVVLNAYANGTERRLTLTYTEDLTINVSSRSSLNVRIYGIY